MCCLAMNQNIDFLVARVRSEGLIKKPIEMGLLQGLVDTINSGPPITLKNGLNNSN